MDQIVSQKPDNISYEEAERILKKNNENVTEALIEMWNIAPPPAKKTPSKWDEIRETCDAYDKEMENFMNQMRK